MICRQLKGKNLKRSWKAEAPFIWRPYSKIEGMLPLTSQSIFVDTFNNDIPILHILRLFSHQFCFVYLPDATRYAVDRQDAIMISFTILFLRLEG